MPSTPRAPVHRLGERFTPLRDRDVLLLLLTTVTLFTGIYLFSSYIGVVFGRATSHSGVRLAVVLFVSGCAGTVGNLLTGFVIDRIGPRAMVAICAVVAAGNFAVMPLVANTVTGALGAVAIYGVTAWAFAVPQQHRLVTLAPHR